MPSDKRPFPPPLPPRPLSREPFARVKSDPPPVATEPRTVFESQTIEVDRAVDTPRSGGVDIDARDVLIDAMRQELAQLRALHDARVVPSDPPAAPSRTPTTEPPPTRPSERVRRSKARIALVWSIAGTVLPFLGAAIARQWPHLAEPVDFVLDLVRKLKQL